MKIPFLDLHANYLSIKAEIDEAIGAVIRDSAFIGGLPVQTFERDFAEYLQAGHCIGMGNGTDALEIALTALELPAGSEVIVPANTFIATAEAVTRTGHRVVFCDCEPGSYTMSVNNAERRITPATRAIIPVHLYGRPCDMGAVMDFARRHDLRVIEDCAQAHGAEFDGKRVGTFGDAGAFSFYPGKNLGAYGDAGAIVTNDEALAMQCRKIANHGRIGKYNHEFEGRNSRLDGLQAAILSVKLRHLDQWLARRNSIAASYRTGLANCPAIELPAPVVTGMHHVYHLFVIRTHLRDQLQAYLRKQGVETGIHYPVSLPKLRAYEYCGQAAENLLANRIGGELLSLPIGEHLADAAVQAVVAAVTTFFMEVSCSSSEKNP